VRIVFDVTPLSHPRLGIGNYMHGMLAGLVESAEGRHELVLFAPTGPRNVMRLRSALDGIPGDRRLVVVPPPSNVWRKLWSRSGHLAVEWLTGPFDVFHFSDWMYPPQRAGLRTTTVHDLGPIHHPEWVDKRTRALHVPKAHHAARTCDLLFANSRYTADDVERTLGVPREKIVVAHPGIHPRFRPEGPAANGGYVLAVGGGPRKNVERAEEAARIAGMELRVAGPKGSLGFVDDDRLAELYRGAGAFVFPSLFEGFGIPVVEAMACGTPAVVSSHPSLDEASGDAAVRVDPESPADIALGIRRALDERERLVERGLAHAAGFTWRACGEAMLRGYESARLVAGEEGRPRHGVDQRRT
jgi:glycosyltransferase involved in cell wall biosynthesis